MLSKHWLGSGLKLKLFTASSQWTTKETISFSKRYWVAQSQVLAIRPTFETTLSKVKSITSETHAKRIVEKKATNEVIFNSLCYAAGFWPFNILSGLLAVLT